MPVTIFDVAERAGVSIGTVSRVLNNRDRVHPDTRKRVLQAVRDLDYQRNSLAESLAKKQTNILGLVIPLINDPFFFEIVRGVEDAAGNANYGLLIANQPRLSQGHRYTDTFRKGYVDAMVLVVVDEIPENEIRGVLHQQIPVALVEQHMKGVPSFIADNYGGAREMAEFLLAQGYKRIAYISGSNVTIDNAERFRGLQDVLHEHNLTLPEHFLVKGDYSAGSGTDAMELLLNLPVSERPEVVFAANDRMAIDAIRTAHKHNLQVPEDIAVVGFDDISLARELEPPLTTVSQPAYRLGYLATEYLLQNMNRLDEVTEAPLVKLPTHLIVRASTEVKTPS